MWGIRLNLTQPGLEPDEMAARHQAAVDMAGYADEHGFDFVGLEEHHGTSIGWSPSPLILAGLVLGRTRRIAASITCLLIPLHDPVRLAEDIAVLDLAGGGRLSIVAGVGYRPSEYAAHAKDWVTRGALMDECLDVMLKAWTGEPFEFRGTTMRVTPRPLSQPHPPLMIGGTAKVSARRAARLGLPFFPAAHLPALADYYQAQCRAQGAEPVCLMPAAGTAMLFVHEDPDKAWATLGHHFLAEATTYSAWQTPDVHSSMRSRATTVAELRAEGLYEILTPDQVLAKPPGATLPLHVLCGGMPIDEGWRSVTLFAEQVLPHLG